MAREALDFMAFVLTNLRHHLQKPSEKTIISDFHRELCECITLNRVAIAAPRGFAKSTYMSFFYPLYLLLEVPNTRVVVVSATYSLSVHWSDLIRKELKTNQRIISRYGEIANAKGCKWTGEEFELPNGNAFLARGYGQQIRGFRPTTIIGDDLETDEQVVSEDQRKKFDEWFNSSLTNTLLPDTQMILIGTLLHPESALANIINRGRAGWAKRFYQAIMRHKSIWPEMWPIDELLKRKEEIGEYAFAQEFLNDPLPDDARKFQKKWFKYYDEAPKNLVKFITVDPAIQTTNKNDFTAIVVIGVDAYDNWYVLEYVRRRLLPKETVDVLFDLCLKYNVQAIGIEEMGFQQMLSYEFKEQRAKRNIWPQVVALKSGGKRKSLRIESLQPRYENGKIIHKRGMEELELELLRFPSPQCHDDLIDALAYQQQITRPAQVVEESKNRDSFEEILKRRRSQEVGDGFWGENNYYD